LETLNQYQTTYLISNTILINFIESRDYRLKLMGNAGLKTIINESLELLEPLKSMPIIGDYFNYIDIDSILPAPIKSEKIDIIATWKAQQALVQSHLAPAKDKPKTKAMSQTTIIKPFVVKDPEVITERTYLEYVQLVAEKLYQLPVTLNKLNANPSTPSPTEQEVQAKIKAFVDDLSGLSLELSSTGPASIKKILHAITELQIQISETGKVSHAVMMSQINQIQSQFGAELLLTADSAEFQLGLKYGVFSNTVNKKFNVFAEAVINHCSFENVEQGLELLLDTSATQKRLEAEQNRLKTIQTDTRALDIQQLLFGNEYKNEFGDFTDIKNQEQFLLYYQKIQPYLYEVNYDYNLLLFLRELQTPADFDKALKNIIRDEYKLADMILYLEKSKTLKANLCMERIDALTNQLNAEETEMATKKIAAFKERVFSSYITKLMKDEMGSSADLFLKLVMPDYTTQKSDILKELSVNDIEKQMVIQFKEMTQDIFQKNSTLKQACTKLNTSLTKINQLMQQEEKKEPGNPCREEKIQKLTAYLLDMKQTPDDADLTFIQVRNQNTQALLKSMCLYDSLIDIHDHLIKMHKDINDSDDPLAQEKTATITVMQKMLTSKDTVLGRLTAVTKYGLSEQCQAKLLVNNDHPFVKLLKKVVQFLFHWQSKDESRLSSFKKRLQECKPSAIDDGIPDKTSEKDLMPRVS
ncbi:MAG: hypothetical protein ACHQII_06360, partial [Bacteroidia bacterium]